MFAAPRGTEPAGPVTETLENFGSTPSLNSSLISLAEATVPPTAGIAYSSFAWAKAVVAPQRSASEAAIAVMEVRVIIGLL